LSQLLKFLASALLTSALTSTQAWATLSSPSFLQSAILAAALILSHIMTPVSVSFTEDVTAAK
jgi:hypothetical protein